jgi:hypothetical protein
MAETFGVFYECYIQVINIGGNKQDIYDFMRFGSLGMRNIRDALNILSLFFIRNTWRKRTTKVSLT